MAYLNVKERRLETRIAYIGALHSGRATNFQRLGNARVVDDQLSLVWEPKDDVAFRDCKVRAELVTAPGEASSDTMRALLRTADGVVFVADADPAERARTREVLALLREALAELTHPVPVMVQVNKTDLAPPAVLLEELSVGDWPHVAATAVSGEGVLETTERAVELVLESLRRREIASEAAAAAPAPSRDSNPLLNALRQVLRETVAAHVEEMEERSRARLDQLFAELREQREDLARVRVALTEVTSTLSTLGDTTEGMTLESARHGAELARQLEALARSEREQQNLLTGVKRGVEALPAEIRSSDANRAVQALKGDVDKAGERVMARLFARVAECESRVDRGFTELDAKTAAIVTQFEALIEELKKPKKSWFG